MTKDELIAHLVKDTEQPRDVVVDLLFALADAAVTELAQGRPFVLPGLGRLVPRMAGDGRRGAGDGQLRLHVSLAQGEDLRLRLDDLAETIRATGKIPDGVVTPTRFALHRLMGTAHEGRKRVKVEARRKKRR